MVIEEHKEEISKLNEKESKIYITKLIKEIGKFKMIYYSIKRLKKKIKYI